MRSKTNPFSSPSTTSLKVGFQASQVTCDGGLLLVRELDEGLGLIAFITENVMDDQRGKNTQLSLSHTIAWQDRKM